jgi:chemotaxis protein MotA
MQVMKHLADVDAVGRGIAGAFVATVYGLVVANLLCLPAGGKLKARLRSEVQLREMMLLGVLAIVEGLNPKLIRIRLDSYLVQPAPKNKPAPASGTAAARAAEAEG